MAEMEARDISPFTKYFLSTWEALGSVPQYCINLGMVMHAVISALRRRHRDQKFKVILSYKMNLRPVWVT